MQRSTRHCLFKKTIVTLTIVVIALTLSTSMIAQDSSTPFSRNNLVAWCIVPFDIKKRGPEERAQLLKKMGITKLAYDWRKEHIPTFDAEMDALKNHQITLQGFWYNSGPDPEKDTTLKTILDLLKRHNIRTQLWCMVGKGPNFDQLSQQEKVKAISVPVAYLSNELEKIGCSLGLYNHGGWFGEPENQLAIINHLDKRNIGMVYNFSHAEEQIQRFPEFYPKILPHLYAINITGLKGLNPAEVVPVGTGNIEERMMAIIKNSSYHGPIGIINENFAPDAADGLQLNIDGLKNILKNLGDAKALESFK